MRFPNIIIVMCTAGIIILATLVGLQDRQSDQLRVELRQALQKQKSDCHQANTARAELNVWGTSIDDFLLAAEQARRASGRPSDLAAAEKYRQLQADIGPLPYRDCDGDSEPDVPS